MTGVLEEERDPLDFLADYPTPLSAGQRSDLAWHKNKLEANRAKLRGVLLTFANRKSTTERFAAEAGAKLSILLDESLDNAISTPAPSRALETTSAEVAVGAKRAREEDPTEDHRATTEAALASSAAVPPMATPATIAPSQPTPPTAAPRRKFGFGGLKGLLAEAKKDHAKDDQVRKQREEMAKKAEEDKLRRDVVLGQEELADIDHRMTILNEKIDNITGQFESLVSVLQAMDSEESAYAGAFYFTTSGGEEEAGYEVSFRPAQMTQPLKELISQQVEGALDRYLAFRDRTDPYLIEIEAGRARRALQQRVEEETRHAHIGEVAAVDGSHSTIDKAALGSDAAGSSSGILSHPSNGLLTIPSQSSNGILPLAAPSNSSKLSDEELLHQMMSGEVGGAEGSAALDEAHPEPADEEDMDRYDY